MNNFWSRLICLLADHVPPEATFLKGETWICARCKQFCVDEGDC